MKARGGIWLALAAAAMFLMPGCEFIRKHEKTAIGVGAGAVGGAAIGGLAGGRKGAVIGGVVGALAGGAIGAYVEHKDKTNEQTRQEHNYSPEQGVRLEMTDAVAEPGTVQPGQDVTLKATYAVMAPDSQQAVVVRETRVVRFNGIQVAEANIDVSRTGGTYTSEVPVTLPASSAAGTYEVQITVAAADQTSTLATTFAVD
jgi:hypothetical protein